jgi:hypothetical protein
MFSKGQQLVEDGQARRKFLGLEYIFESMNYPINHFFQDSDNAHALALSEIMMG